MTTYDEEDFVVADLAVCVDCAAVIANGDFPEDDEVRTTIENALERDRGGHWVLDCDDNFDHFSWSPCDLCRRPLGGARHGATFIIR